MERVIDGEGGRRGGDGWRGGGGGGGEWIEKRSRDNAQTSRKNEEEVSGEREGECVCLHV